MLDSPIRRPSLLFNGTIIRIFIIAISWWICIAFSFICTIGVASPIWSLVCFRLAWSISVFDLSWIQMGTTASFIYTCTQFVSAPWIVVIWLWIETVSEGLVVTKAGIDFFPALFPFLPFLVLFRIHPIYLQIKARKCLKPSFVLISKNPTLNSRPLLCLIIETRVYTSQSVSCRVGI